MSRGGKRTPGEGKTLGAQKNGKRLQRKRFVFRWINETKLSSR